MAVANFAPTVRSLVMGLLVATLALPAVSAPPAAADTSGPAPADALNAKIKQDATLIHQLTEELDQARLRVSSTADRLVSVTRQHDNTVVVLGANRAVLLQQAVRAYMHGGATAGAAAGADVTLGSEYLRVASGDLANTGDQLRVLEANLRSDLDMLRTAQHASVQATVELQALRANALSAAAKEQVQLEVLQSQLTAKAQAAAAAAVAAPAGVHVTPPPATQGVPVNNGLVAVVQQAAGLPVATPVVKPVTPAAPPAAAGGHAGGPWLALRRCESSDNYGENTGNGYYGAYQFSLSTWLGLGFPGRPDLESPAMQDEAAMKLQAQSGWGQWPACSAALGLA